MNKYLRMALVEATKSRCKQKHGAVIVNNGAVVAKAFNIQKFIPHPDSTDWRISAVHAEEAALAKLGGRVPNGARMYVARISPSGIVNYSAPCKRCFGLIRRSGVSSITWT